MDTKAKSENELAIEALIELAGTGQDHVDEDMYYDKAAYTDEDRDAFRHKCELVSKGSLLASAAPDLLAACEAVLQDLADYKACKLSARVFAQLNKVVAKAKGE